MLAPVGIDAIDPTFDAVPAHTAVVVIALQQAFAGIDNEDTAPVELSRTARVREAQPTQGTGLFGETALTRAPREGDLGDEIVGAGQVVVAPRDHVFTFTRRERAVKRDAEPATPSEALMARGRRAADRLARISGRGEARGRVILARNRGPL